MRRRTIPEGFVGTRFERYVVVSSAGYNDKHGLRQWLCRCDCGTERVVLEQSLKRGATRSCGCLHREQLAERATKHGGTARAEYRIWTSMVARCYSHKHHKYHRYGGRGVTVCDSWRADFSNFLRDMGPRPSTEYSIDRVNNDGNYEPGNCRWATRKQQQRNMSSNHILEHDGVAMPIAGWAERLGVDYNTITSRIRHGWTTKAIVTTPVMAIGQKRTKQERTNG